MRTADPTTPDAAAPPVPVLITARELDHGGIERDVAKIAMHLDRSRFEPHVAAFHAKGMRFEELRAAGVPILPLPLTSLASLAALQAALRMRRYIRTHGIRIVHSYDASGVFAVPIARALRVPVVIASQLSYRSLLDRKTWRLLRMTDPLADAILVNCEAIRRHMIEDEHVPAGRVELCYNGVDTTQFYPADTPKHDLLRDSPLVVGTVCVLRPEKALPVLQEAFARVIPLEPNAKLLVIGSGPELPRLKENAARLGIAGASVFVPATPEVVPWMRSIDIFVLPSYSEAFSNSLLEAMACGCAVIGSRVGGTPEMIGENERGLLFHSGNAGDLADQLTKLIVDRALRREFADRAARFVRQNLTIEIAARRTAQMYERLLQRKRGRA
jgi:glycosyltransferase involved in cell wall biosynthesis